MLHIPKRRPINTHGTTYRYLPRLVSSRLSFSLPYYISTSISISISISNVFTHARTTEGRKNQKCIFIYHIISYHFISYTFVCFVAVDAIYLSLYAFMHFRSVGRSVGRKEGNAAARVRTHARTHTPMYEGRHNPYRTLPLPSLASASASRIRIRIRPPHVIAAMVTVMIMIVIVHSLRAWFLVFCAPSRGHAHAHAIVRHTHMHSLRFVGLGARGCSSVGVDL